MGQNHLNDNMIFNYCCAKLTKEFQIAYVDKDVYHWWWIRRVSQVTKWGAVQLHLTSFLLLLLLESTLKMKYTCKDIYYWSLVKQTNKLSMLILMHPVAWLMIHVWHEMFSGIRSREHQMAIAKFGWFFVSCILFPATPFSLHLLRGPPLFFFVHFKMEVDSPTIPQSVIDDEQHTMYYYQALPYAHLLDLEAKEWLDDIVTNLIACIKARDFSRGVAFWTKHLSLYVR